MNPKDLLEKLAKQQDEVFSGKKEFIAPILASNSVVATRIAGILYKFRIFRKGKREAGWYIFRARDEKEAVLVGPAEQDQIAEYQKLFRVKRYVLAYRMEDHWLGLPSDSEVGQQPASVYLAQGVEQFDAVDCVFDGKQAWYVNLFLSRDPSIAMTLRENLEKENKSIKAPGLTPADRYAYALAFALREEALKSNTEKRLERQLALGGAKLKSYVEAGTDTLAVTLNYEGRDFRINVRASDLTVTSAGICLSGEDRKFDLASMPSIFREKDERDRRGYDGGDGDDYD